MLNCNTWNQLAGCKQMNNFQLDMEYLINRNISINSNTWNHLIVCKQMINS